MGVFQGGMEFTMSAMQVVVIALGGAFIMRGQMDYVDLITFSLYVTTFISPIRTLVNFMEVFTDGTAGFQRFLELMRIQPDIADAPDARELPPVRGQVDYNDVSFDYAGGVNVLSHIDLHIARARRWPSSVRRAAARRRCASCCRGFTMSRPARYASTASTCAP